MDDKQKAQWEGLTVMSKNNPKAYTEFIRKQSQLHEEEQANVRRNTFVPTPFPLTVMGSQVRNDNSSVTPVQDVFKVEQEGERNIVLDVITIHLTGHAEVGLPQLKARPGVVADSSTPVGKLAIPQSVGTLAAPEVGKRGRTTVHAGKIDEYSTDSIFADEEVEQFVALHVKATRRNILQERSASKVNVHVVWHCCDVVFHPDQLQRCAHDLECKLAVIQLSLDYILEDHNVHVGKDYVMLDKTVSNGLKQVLYTKEGLEALKAEDALEKNTVADENEKEYQTIMNDILQSVQSGENPKTTPVTLPTMDMLRKHQQQQEQQEQQRQDDLIIKPDTTIPNKTSLISIMDDDKLPLSYTLLTSATEYTVQIALNQELSMSNINVDTTSTHINIDSIYYHGSVSLPRPIDIHNAVAKWSKKKHVLTITAPIQQ